MSFHMKLPITHAIEGLVTRDLNPLSGDKPTRHALSVSIYVDIIVIYGGI